MFLLVWVAGLRRGRQLRDADTGAAAVPGHVRADGADPVQRNAAPARRPHHPRHGVRAVALHPVRRRRSHRPPAQLVALRDEKLALPHPKVRPHSEFIGLHRLNIFFVTEFTGFYQFVWQCLNELYQIYRTDRIFSDYAELNQPIY